MNQDLTIYGNISSSGNIDCYLSPRDEPLQLPLVDHKQRLRSKHCQNPVSLKESPELQQQRASQIVSQRLWAVLHLCVTEWKIGKIETRCK